MLRAHIDDQALFPAAIGRLIDCRDDLVPVLAPHVVDAPFGCVGPGGGPPPTPPQWTHPVPPPAPSRGGVPPPAAPPVRPGGALCPPPRALLSPPTSGPVSRRCARG